IRIGGIVEGRLGYSGGWGPLRLALEIQRLLLVKHLALVEAMRKAVGAEKSYLQASGAKHENLKMLIAIRFAPRSLDGDGFLIRYRSLDEAFRNRKGMTLVLSRM